MPSGPDVLAVLAVSGLLIVPGLPLALAVCRPGSTRPLTVVAAAIGLGYAFVAAVSFALSFLHLLTGPVILGCCAAVAIGTSVPLVRSGRAADHLDVLREAVTRRPFEGLSHVLVVLAFVAVRWTYPAVMNIAPTTLRYWADAMEITDAHGFTPTTLQWGRLLPVTVSKVVLNTFDASVASIVGPSPLRALGALLFVVSIGLVIASLALAHELGLRLAAPLLPILLFGGTVFHSDLAVDLNRNRAENWGRLVAIVAATLAIHVIRQRPWRADAGAPGSLPEERRRRADLRLEIGAAGVLFGVGMATHLVAVAAVGGFLFAYVVAAMIVERDAGPCLRSAASIAGLAAVVGGATLWTAPGDIGLSGAFDQAQYATKGTSAVGAPIADPTLYIATGHIGADGIAPGRGIGDATLSVARALGTHFGDPAPLAIAVGVGLLLVSAFVMLSRTHRLRTLVVASLAFAGVLMLAALAFSLHYHEFALANFGARRLFDYAPLVWAPILVGAAEVALLRSIGGRHRRHRVPARTMALAASLGLVLTTLPAAAAPEVRIQDATAAIPLFDWVSRNVPCEGRVLMDRRTLGTFQVLTGHAGVIEGMGPHIRPSVLGLAVNDMLHAWNFFRDPKGGATYLHRNGVAAVIVTARGNALGGLVRFEDERRRLFPRLPFLTAAFQNEAGTVYLVHNYVPDPLLPRVEGRPGFRCGAAVEA